MKYFHGYTKNEAIIVAASRGNQPTNLPTTLLCLDAVLNFKGPQKRLVSLGIQLGAKKVGRCFTCEITT